VNSPISASTSLRLVFGKSKGAESTARQTSLTTSPEPTTDALLVAVQHQDREAFAILFRRYCRLVASIGRDILRSQEEAEDLVQDVFLYIWTRSPQCVSDKRHSAHDWVVRIIYHRAFDRRRYLMTRLYFHPANDDGKSEKRIEKAAADSGSVRGLDTLLHRRSVLETAFQKLTTRQRNILKLYFYEGLSLHEVAEKLGDHHMNVRNHFYRGIYRLRECVSVSDWDIG
jgi:RNA polymerase sigma-70 factor (ECF subfamily)